MVSYDLSLSHIYFCSIKFFVFFMCMLVDSTVVNGWLKNLSVEMSS